MLRPCLTCGHYADPEVSDRCPECGADAPPKAWVIVQDAPPAWCILLLHASAALAAMGLTIWLSYYFFGSGAPRPFSALFIGVPLIALSLTRLAGGASAAKFNSAWIIREHEIEHVRAFRMNARYTKERGWSATHPMRHRSNPHRWTIHLVHTSGRRIARIVTDDRVDDPALVEAAARKALSSPASPNAYPLRQETRHLIPQGKESPDAPLR